MAKKISKKASLAKKKTQKKKSAPQSVAKKKSETLLAKGSTKKKVSSSKSKKAIKTSEAESGKSKLKAKPKGKPSGRSKAASKKVTAARSKASKVQSLAPQKSVSQKKSAAQPLDWTEILTPMDDRILVIPKGVEEETSSGLILIHKEEPDVREAKVHVVGRGHRNEKGHFRPLDVKINDRVLFSRYGGQSLKILEQEVVLLRESEILAVKTK